MALIGKWLAAGALAASMIAAPAIAETDESSPKMVKLPVQGSLYMRETSSGATVIVSEDGRFVMPGRVVDRQENHTMIDSVDKAQEMFGGKSKSVSAGPDKSSELTNSEGFPNHENLLSFSIGNGPKAVYVWVDPLCPYCHKVVEMQEDLADEFTFHNLVVPLLGERSERASEALSCMPEKQRHGAMQKNQYETSSENCESKSLANSQRLATAMQVEAVPTIVSPNRQSVTGAPSSVEQLAQFLRGEMQ